MRRRLPRRAGAAAFAAGCRHPSWAAPTQHQFYHNFAVAATVFFQIRGLPPFCYIYVIFSRKSEIYPRPRRARRKKTAPHHIFGQKSLKQAGVCAMISTCENLYPQTRRRGSPFPPSPHFPAPERRPPCICPPVSTYPLAVSYVRMRAM